MPYFLQCEVDKICQLEGAKMNGLKAVRKQCNMTIQELADKLCVSKQIVSAWENGVKEIPATRKLQLSQLFGLDIESFGEVNEEEANSFAKKATKRLGFSSDDIETDNGVEKKARLEGFAEDELRDTDVYNAFVKSKELQKGVESEIHSYFVPVQNCSIKDYMNNVMRTTTLYKGFNEVVYTLNRLEGMESDYALFRILETLNAMVTEMGGTPDRIVDGADQSFDMNKDYIDVMRKAFRSNLENSKRLFEKIQNITLGDMPFDFKWPSENDVLTTDGSFKNPEDSMDYDDYNDYHMYERENIDTQIDYDGDGE